MSGRLISQISEATTGAKVASTTLITTGGGIWLGDGIWANSWTWLGENSAQVGALFAGLGFIVMLVDKLARCFKSRKKDNVADELLHEFHEFLDHHRHGKRAEDDSSTKDDK